MPNTNALILSSPNFQLVRSMVSVYGPSNGMRDLEISGHGFQVQYHLRHEALDAAEAGLPGRLAVKRHGQLGQADRLHGAECS